MSNALCVAVCPTNRHWPSEPHRVVPRVPPGDLPISSALDAAEARHEIGADPGHRNEAGALRKEKTTRCGLRATGVEAGGGECLRDTHGVPHKVLTEYLTGHGRRTEASACRVLTECLYSQSTSRATEGGRKRVPAHTRQCKNARTSRTSRTHVTHARPADSANAGPV